MKRAGERAVESSYGRAAASAFGAPIGLRELLWNGLHLAALSALAVAQPLFETLDASFFAAFGATRADVILVALVVVLGPPAALLLAEALASPVPTLARALHLLFVGGLVALLVRQAAEAAGAASLVQYLAGSMAGVGAALAYRSFAPARSFATALVPAPIVFMVLFLVLPPMSQLTLASEYDVRGRKVAGTTPLVIVVLDELPLTSLLGADGEIDAGRYPNFARFASTSTWFRNATTVHSETHRAVPAILTGNRVSTDSVPVALDHRRSLFTLLGGSYRVNASEPHTDLCPEQLCPEKSGSFYGRMRSLLRNTALLGGRQLLPGPLGNRLPAIDNFRTLDLSEQVAGFNRGLAAGRRPGFHFIHLLAPHEPWNRLPSGVRYPDGFQSDAPRPQGDLRLRNDRWTAIQAYQRHLLQLGYADRLLGRIIDRLKSTGLYDRSVVVLVADHGASFRPGDSERDVTRTNLQDILSVPLFVKARGQRSARASEQPAETIDVVATAAKLIGVDLPWGTDGSSVRAGKGPDRRTVRVTAFGQEDPVTVSLAAFLKRKRAALRRHVKIFGASRGWSGVFGVGPHREVLGRRVPSAPGGMGSVELDQRDVFRSIDPSSGVLPARITGRIRDGEVPPGRPLAIALNGRVRATTPTYSLHGAVAFSAMVPESAFRKGANQVQVLAILPARGGVRMAPL